MKIIGITMGDPAGVGPEISVKALAANEEYRNQTIIFGSVKIIQYYLELLKIQILINVIDEPEDFKPGCINVLNVMDVSFDDLQIGVQSPIAGDAAYQYIERAIRLAMEGRIGPIVTAPLNKAALHDAGHVFDGHTEIFATLTNTSQYTMMLWSERMSVVHASTHVSLEEACRRVTKERVLECIHLAAKAMKDLGKENPRIAVAGLNPHCGEGGLFGMLDLEEIVPAVEEAQKEGLNVQGPVPPDTVFLKASNGVYDIVVAMYHDQGHIPMKMIAFDSGVNVTLGLPIIRTSVDHGTAFDIAGKGIAKEDSILWALKLATQFADNAK